VVIQWYWIWDEVSKECPEYCAWLTRLAREGDAPNFACRGKGEAAVGCGVLGMEVDGDGVIGCVRAGPWIRRGWGRAAAFWSH
jgi:hypothetical protein